MSPRIATCFLCCWTITLEDPDYTGLLSFGADRSASPKIDGEGGLCAVVRRLIGGEQRSQIVGEDNGVVSCTLVYCARHRHHNEATKSSWIGASHRMVVFCVDGAHPQPYAVFHLMSMVQGKAT